ncbi:hypothetical protein NHP190003_01260 [Helicobacter sp. NHP19-003]|uniref:Uncharacterized protein n=1 Tax=Helicobacter gastrocanis TaxID=2849641 RepID=A0ABN6I2C2_9HELI|nr:hypothetical protein [Helicobacter sp. NHP19-003]BCZ16844.1 hypothetical protein NHP190003_01260 [Helicobacter sp. NHP19-003]
MEVKDIKNNPSLYALLGSASLGQAQSLQAPQAPAGSKPEVLVEISKSQTEPNGLKRETYGFLVLELMSDNEYDAFLRATAGMNENEKRLAAQSLYSLTSFYGGQIQEDKQAQEKIDGLKALQEMQAKRAFGINNDFVQRYKNAYNQVYQAMDLHL